MVKLSTLESNLMQAIVTKTTKDIEQYKNDLRQVKNILRVPRLTEQYRKALLEAGEQLEFEEMFTS